jgi:hypothetical protein
VQHMASQGKETGLGMGFCNPLQTPATPELSHVMSRPGVRVPSSALFFTCKIPKNKEPPMFVSEACQQYVSSRLLSQNFVPHISEHSARAATGVIAPQTDSAHLLKADGHSFGEHRFFGGSHPPPCITRPHAKPQTL